MIKPGMIKEGMSAGSGSGKAGSRAPQAFEPDDPRLAPAPPEPEPIDTASGGAAPGGEERTTRPMGLPDRAAIAKGIGWGSVLLSAMGALAVLAASISFARFVSVALERDDWVGWTAVSLLAVAGFAGAILLLRELVGIFRLARLGRMRREADGLLLAPDAAREKALAGQLVDLMGVRPENAWALARFRDHQRDVRDAGDLLRLADRELVAPIDRDARRLVLASAKRVATVTAISPMAFVAVGYVLVENLGLMRRLATLYGGRPGFIGGLRLARMVVGHIIATGGIALTDDLLGQFLGQDLLRRLSRRLGEGAFNGALTARLGAAAIDVCRPIPFIEATPVRARDIVSEIFRRAPGTSTRAPQA